LKTDGNGGTSHSEFSVAKRNSKIGTNNIINKEQMHNGKIINNYVKITNIININENFTPNIADPTKLEMEIRTNIRKKSSVLNDIKKSSI